MEWLRNLRHWIAALREARKKINPSLSTLNPVDAAPITSISPEEALRSIPTLAKIHNLLATAVNRLNFHVRVLGQIVEDLSYTFDYYSGAAFADWHVAGYTIFDTNLEIHTIIYASRRPLLVRMLL